MQSLKSIRLAEVDNFFKQSFEQKQTDSTVLVPLANLQIKENDAPQTLGNALCWALDTRRQF